MALRGAPVGDPGSLGELTTRPGRRRPDEVRLISLADEVSAETMVRFLVCQPEAAGQVDTDRRDQHAVGPQLQPAVSGRAREVHTGTDKPAADAEAARSRQRQQSVQLRRLRVRRHAEYAPCALTIYLRDPGRLLRGVVLGGEVRDDPRYQRLEA